MRDKSKKQQEAMLVGLYQLLSCQVEVFHVIIIIQQLLKQLMNGLNPCVQPHHAVLYAAHPLQIVCRHLLNNKIRLKQQYSQQRLQQSGRYP